MQIRPILPEEAAGRSGAAPVWVTADPSSAAVARVRAAAGCLAVAVDRGSDPTDPARQASASLQHHRRWLDKRRLARCVPRCADPREWVVAIPYNSSQIVSGPARCRPYCRAALWLCGVKVVQMLDRRDIAPIACYGALFAAVVLWAALRPVNPNLSDSHEGWRASMVAGQHDAVDDQLEMRRVAKHMKLP